MQHLLHKLITHEKIKNLNNFNFLILIILPILVVLTSLILTIYLVPTQLVFGFDQARDAYEAYSIWHNHHLKILGPSSDIPGINHGVLWYYVLAFVYFLGNGIPENAVYIVLLGLYAFIPVIGYLTYKMSKSYVVTFVALALYAMSPLYFSFTHWLSNPLLSLFIAPPLFYLLWRYLHKPNIYNALLIGFLYGLLIQSDFGFIILLLVLPVYYFVFALRFQILNIVGFIVGLLAGLLPFFIAYLKFHTNVVAIISAFVLGSPGKGELITEKALGLIDSIVNLLTFTYLPLPPLVAFFVLIFVVIYFHKIFFGKKDVLTRLAIIWLSGILFIFVFNHGNLSAVFLYGPFLYPLAIIYTIYLTRMIENIKWLLVAMLIIVGLQFVTISIWTQSVKSPLSVQQGMTINYERQLIDYIYQSSNRQPIVISTVTNPLNINTTWAYLFDFYGKPKYGYVPYLWGKDQTGYLGDLPMQRDLNFPLQRYLIIEPRAGIGDYWFAHGIYDEDLLSDVIEEKQFGSFTVQKRIFHPNKKYFQFKSPTN